MAQLLDEIQWAEPIVPPVTDPAWEAEVTRRGGRIGGIDRRTLRVALTWGTLPDIRIVDMAPLGAFTPFINSQEIRIQRAMVNEFEAGRGRRDARAGSVFLVGVTLLHELTHWADDQDGIDRDGEEGEEFEIERYGSVIQ